MHGVRARAGVYWGFGALTMQVAFISRHRCLPPARDSYLAIAAYHPPVRRQPPFSLLTPPRARPYRSTNIMHDHWHVNLHVHLLPIMSQPLLIVSSFPPGRYSQHGESRCTKRNWRGTSVRSSRSQTTSRCHTPTRARVAHFACPPSIACYALRHRWTTPKSTKPASQQPACPLVSLLARVLLASRFCLSCVV